MATLAGAGIVVIGRNEGAHLERCLASALAAGVPVVYVDSASTDQSLAIARRHGVTIVELDATEPLTAARARNAGLERLLEQVPSVELVQFVDGDCELLPQWLEAAAAALRAHDDAWVVWGRLRERYPERSVYNLVCDVEWRFDEVPGEVTSCGGIAMMRARAIAALGAFDASLRAGEEPELCARVRAAGGRIVHLGEDMAYHDADIRSFAQWWRRAVRTGYSYAEGAARSRAAAEPRWSRQVRRILIWGGVLPAVALAAAYPTGGLSLLAFGLHLVPLARSAGRVKRRGASRRASLWYGAFTVADKVPQLCGWLAFQKQHTFGGARTRQVACRA